jgi:hypothetical protein
MGRILQASDIMEAALEAAILRRVARPLDRLEV